MSYTAMCFAYSAVLLLVSGVFAWITNRRGTVNCLFLLLCVLLCVGACSTSFMYTVPTMASCLRWYHFSWIGWCFYPPVFVLMALTLSRYTQPLRQRWGWVVLFLPAVSFFLRSRHIPFDVDGFTRTAAGTFTPHYVYSAWAVAYYCFERLCALLGLAILWIWARRSSHRREKLQVRAMIICSLLPEAVGMLTYLFGPHGELDAFLAISLCLPALGLCYAIVRYQFVVPLTTLAASHVLAHVKDVVLFTTETGEMVEVNRSAELLLGFTERELFGKPLTHLLAVDDPGRRQWAGTAPAEFPWMQVMDAVTATGEHIPLQFTCSRLSDRYGDILGLVVIAEDLRPRRQLEREIAERTAAERALQQLNEELEERIAQRMSDLAGLNEHYYTELQERRRTEKALVESETRYRTLFENAGDGIFIIDEALCVIAANEKACTRTGYTREELARLTPMDIMPSELLVTLPAILREIYTSGHAVYETIHLTKDGRPLYLEMNSCLIDDEGTKSILTIARDLTERKRLEEGERMLQQLQEATRLRTEFLSYISHELKTPLTPIIGGVDLLVSGDAGAVPPEQRIVLAMIDRQARRLLRLIEDMLDLLCVEQGHLSLDKRPVQLAELLQDSVTAYAERFLAHGLSLQFLAPEAALPPIAGDAQRLEQIFDNLLSNALKYTPHGDVVVQCDRHDGMLRVRISDTGIGMTAEKCRRIFEPFYQVDTHQPGAGLGLAIVKHLVDAHDGSISVTSDGLNRGTCFTLLFHVPLENGVPLT